MCFGFVWNLNFLKTLGGLKNKSFSFCFYCCCWDYFVLFSFLFWGQVVADMNLSFRISVILSQKQHIYTLYCFM